MQYIWQIIHPKKWDIWQCYEWQKTIWIAEHTPQYIASWKFPVEKSFKKVNSLQSHCIIPLYVSIADFCIVVNAFLLVCLRVASVEAVLPFLCDPVFGGLIFVLFHIIDSLCGYWQGHVGWRSESRLWYDILCISAALINNSDTFLYAWEGLWFGLPIKINFYYGMYLSSGSLMDGAAFSAWQVEGSQTHCLLGRICLGRAAVIIQYETTSYTHAHTCTHAHTYALCTCILIFSFHNCIICNCCMMT